MSPLQLVIGTASQYLTLGLTPLALLKALTQISLASRLQRVFTLECSRVVLKSTHRTSADKPVGRSIPITHRLSRQESRNRRKGPPISRRTATSTYSSSPSQLMLEHPVHTSSSASKLPIGNKLLYITRLAFNPHSAPLCQTPPALMPRQYDGAGQNFRRRERESGVEDSFNVRSVL